MQLVVVIPTRNRADLAPAAIDSALAEQDPRVTVLVSDNSTDAEQLASLESCCAAFPSERVRYVRPPQPLPMTAHWQWALERALEPASTTHVLYLSDRRALRRGAIPSLLELAERHPADVLTFGDDAMLADEDEPVSLLERGWTDKLVRVDSDHLLRITARGMGHVAVPRMLNSVVPRTVLEEVDRAYGNVFASIAPDHCFAYRCLDRLDSILYWDRVLSVQRGLSRSNGYSQIRGVASTDHADFLRELGDATINEHAPVPELLTVTNAAYNEYEYVRREPASSKLAPLSRHYYLGANARDVAQLEDPQLRARMRVVLSDNGWSSWTRTRYLLGLSAAAAAYYGRHPLALLARLRGQPVSRADFGDAAEALAYAVENPGVASAGAQNLWPLLSRWGAARELSA